MITKLWASCRLVTDIKVEIPIGENKAVQAEVKSIAGESGYLLVFDDRAKAEQHAENFGIVCLETTGVSDEGKHTGAQAKATCKAKEKDHQ